MTAPEAKPSADQIAMELAKLTDADLPATLAILAGMLQGVRESDGSDNVVAGARWAADALRLELNKWRETRNGDDRLKELREAGKAASKRD